MHGFVLWGKTTTIIQYFALEKFMAQFGTQDADKSKNNVKWYLTKVPVDGDHPYKAENV